MKSKIKKPSMTAALFFIGKEKADKIAALFRTVNINTMIPPHEKYGGKIGALMELYGYPSADIPSADNIDGDELVIFGFSDRTVLDKALYLLRENNISVRFKAVLTEYNKDFTLSELMEHMFSEEREIERLRQ